MKRVKLGLGLLFLFSVLLVSVPMANPIVQANVNQVVLNNLDEQNNGSIVANYMMTNAPTTGQSTDQNLKASDYNFTKTANSAWPPEVATVYIGNYHLVGLCMVMNQDALLANVRLNSAPPQEVAYYVIFEPEACLLAIIRNLPLLSQTDVSHNHYLANASSLGNNAGIIASIVRRA